MLFVLTKASMVIKDGPEFSWAQRVMCVGKVVMTRNALRQKDIHASNHGLGASPILVYRIPKVWRHCCCLLCAIHG